MCNGIRMLTIATERVRTCVCIVRAHSYVFQPVSVFAYLRQRNSMCSCMWQYHIILPASKARHIDAIDGDGDDGAEWEEGDQSFIIWCPHQMSCHFILPSDDGNNVQSTTTTVVKAMSNTFWASCIDRDASEWINWIYYFLYLLRAVTRVSEYPGIYFLPTMHRLLFLFALPCINWVIRRRCDRS